MIIHDAADLFTTLMVRATAVVGIGAGLLVLAVVLITTAVTGAWPRRQPEDTA